MRPFLFIGLIFMLSAAGPARAEYRAFELVIKNPTSGQEVTVLSTLDPVQYTAYYPVKNGEIVMYRATWRCRGNTSQFKAICPNPKAAQN